MGVIGQKWGLILALVWSFLLASIFVVVTAERSITSYMSNSTSPVSQLLDYLWQADKSGYRHVWPELEFGWQIVIGSIIGFFGAAFGSAGGVGGGGIFVPLLTLVIGFDPKSATALSKCMIMGVTATTVYYNLKLRHPTLEMPIIDYDLALLIQPMLLLGISLGVDFNVIFSDWMVTVLLIFLFLGTSTTAFLRGIETWKKETIMKMDAAMQLESNGIGQEAEYTLLPRRPNDNGQEAHNETEPKVSILENVSWKEFGLLVLVWVLFLSLQIIKTYTTTCSTLYWVVNLLQFPVSFGVSLFEAIGLNKGWRKIASTGNDGANLKVHQLLTYCLFGVTAGMLGGLLGLGGGFVLGPMFLELGVPPQVSGATATFVMMFSSSIAVVEYYFLHRFPVPYALYLFVLTTIAAVSGQHVVRKLINKLGRPSLIIFIMAFIIFVSAIVLGGTGIINMIGKIKQHEYMGFENLCTYEG